MAQVRKNSLGIFEEEYNLALIEASRPSKARSSFPEDVDEPDAQTKEEPLVLIDQQMPLSDVEPRPVDVVDDVAPRLVDQV